VRRENHLLERVQTLLPMEPVLGAYGATAAAALRGGRAMVPPKEYRTLIFEGHRMPGDTWGAFWGTLGRILAGDVLETPPTSLEPKSDRETAQKRNYRYYGEWTSAAGRLLVGLQPRSKAGVYPVLAVTEHCLHVACIQRKRGTYAKLGDAMQLTCTIQRRDLGWVRERGEPSFEFGFRDGSWATLDLVSSDMGRLFPDMLSKKTPIPW
jgi:hypothetical protein